MGEPREWRIEQGHEILHNKCDRNMNRGLSHTLQWGAKESIHLGTIVEDPGGGLQSKLSNVNLQLPSGTGLSTIRTAQLYHPSHPGWQSHIYGNLGSHALVNYSYIMDMVNQVNI
jgi:hypothetical protein